MTMARTDRGHLITEQRNPDSMHLDQLTPLEIVDLLHRQNLEAVQAVETQREQIAQAIDMVVASFSQQGRLIYIGSGTSGRLGVLDAAECPPTFGVPPWWVQGHISGGAQALVASVEHAEDDTEEAVRLIHWLEAGPCDTVMGIAAGGTTPFALAAIKQARKQNAKTIFFTCIPPDQLAEPVDLIIAPVVGPEIVTGSTRLKAGTATKLVLNAITTGAMVRMGKVYENLMVDVKRACSKLEDRANRIVRTVTGVGFKEAERLLDRAGGSAKLAIVMHFRHCDARRAAELLAEAGGQLRPVIEAAH